MSRYPGQPDHLQAVLLGVLLGAPNPKVASLRHTGAGNLQEIRFQAVPWLMVQEPSLEVWGKPKS